MKRVALILAAVALTVVGQFAAVATTSKSGGTVAAAPGYSISYQDGETVLTIGFYANVTSIDPATACSTEDAKITTQLYDRLVGYATKTLEDGTVAKDDQTIAPRLAQSWDISEDGKTYTFHLTPDVKFPSGAPVDADAVAYSFNRILTMKQCGLYSFSAGLSGNILSVTAVDPLTVQVQLNESDPIFLNAMAKSGAGIVDKTLVEANGGVVAEQKNEWMNTNSAGSGPYIVEKFAPSEEIQMRANETYRGGKPYFDRVIWKIITDPANRVLLTERGDLQLTYNIPFRDQLRLAENDDLKIVRQPGLKITFVGLNNGIEPFNNPLVRQALSYAVPYDAIIEQVTSGLALPMKSIIPPLMADHDPSFFDKSTDLEKAKQLLAEAGLPDGFTFTLDIQSGSQEFDDIAVILQDQFRQIGVTMEIRKSDLAKYYEFVRGDQSQAYLIARTTGINDPGYFLGYMLPCGSTFAYSAYCNEQVDVLLGQARHEVDAAKRKELYAQIQQLVVADAPDLWLYVNPDAMVMAKNVEGLIYDTTLQEELVNLTEAAG
ncbi:MAG: peptide/nickel transport system substrate-binding protein [Thermomicrobiales bacterium]|nr:peptide/nickel transport system substrate-binding protein [Thermomicrobiales bacterium]